MNDLVRAALFDLDGTLVDSEFAATLALRAAYTGAGLPGEPPVGEFHALAGRPIEDIVARLGLPLDLAGRFQQAAAGLTGHVQVFPGAGDLLRDLRARQVRIGVITGKDRVRTDAILEHVGISELVDLVVTPDDAPAPKPAPDGVAWLCEQFGVSAEHAVMVGDSAADLRAGNAAGVRTVACLWGAGRAEVLALHRPWRTVARFGDLAAVLLAHTKRGAPSREESPAVSGASAPADSASLSGDVVHG